MHKQRGMTFIGVVLLVATIVFVAVIAMKLMPAYLEFMSVKKVITKVSKESNFATMSNKEIADSFDRSAVIDDIKNVTGKDLEISKSPAGTPVVIADYQVLVPLMGNVSALLDFKASTDSSQSTSVAE
jgi:hypothetical protein